MRFVSAACWWWHNPGPRHTRTGRECVSHGDALKWIIHSTVRTLKAFISLTVTCPCSCLINIPRA